MHREGKTALERQEADCRAWAAGHGLVVRQVHVDRIRSGFKRVARKDFEAARRAVTSGAVRTLIVWKLDRLSRKGAAEVGPLLDEFRLRSGPVGLCHGRPGLDFSRRRTRHGLTVGVGTSRGGNPG
ncbi:recombinase family protein [Streptomyces massasporeus]|uniref:recombinase family protein n=1 Tax=Streptomyces massasporeus TaxID=67324 RepID=UPI00369C7C29